MKVAGKVRLYSTYCQCFISLSVFSRVKFEPSRLKDNTLLIVISAVYFAKRIRIRPEKSTVSFYYYLTIIGSIKFHSLEVTFLTCAHTAHVIDIGWSVRPSHAGIVSKRLNLSSNCLHCLVAPCF